MNGAIDQAGRALVALRVSDGASQPAAEVIFWIDTAFDGELVISNALVKQVVAASVGCG